jgi:hypothetical protein
MDKLMQEYQERFGEQFPLMLCRGCDDEEIEEIIKKCLKENKPHTAGEGDY